MTNAILALAVEGLAVGLLTLLAGAGKDAGSIVLLFMIGLWLIFLVTHSGVISRVAKTTGNIGQLAQ